MHTNIGLALKPNFMSSLSCRVLYLFKFAFSLIPFRILVLIIEDRYLLFLYLVFIPICHDEAVQDVISSKTI